MAAQENIRRPADLRGKNLGIQEVGAFREVMTRAVLHSAGLTPQDVNYVPVSSAGYIAALTANKIDTAILHIGQAYMARTKRGVPPLLGPALGGHAQLWYGTFSSTEDLLRKDPDLLGRAVRPHAGSPFHVPAMRIAPSIWQASTLAIRRKSRAQPMIRWPLRV